MKKSLYLQIKGKKTESDEATSDNIDTDTDAGGLEPERRAVAVARYESEGSRPNAY